MGFFFFFFGFDFPFHVTWYLLEIRKEWLVNSGFGGCFHFSPLYLFHVFSFSKGGGGKWKKFAKQDNSWVEEQILRNVNSMFLFLHLFAPSPPERDPPSSWIPFLANNGARGRCQPGSGAVRAGWHIWVKITHNAPNWIKQSRRIFYSWFHPGSRSVVAFPYSYPPRIPFLELHPKTFTAIWLNPKKLFSWNFIFFKVSYLFFFFFLVWKKSFDAAFPLPCRTPGDVGSNPVAVLWDWGGTHW